MIKPYLKALLLLCAVPAQAYNIYNQTGEKLYVQDFARGGMLKTIQPGGMESCKPTAGGCNGYKYFVVKPKKNGGDCAVVSCIWNGFIKGKGNYFIIHQTNVAFPESGYCYIELRNDSGAVAPVSAKKCPGKPSTFAPERCGVNDAT